MLSKRQHKTYLCKRLSSLGIRQGIVHTLVDDIYRWIDSSGPEWTISRLKSLKVAFFNELAGNPSWPSWIASRADGLPKGAIGVVLRDAIASQEPRKVQRAISMLMVYSDMVSNHVTKKQWTKFQSSVEKTPEFWPSFSGSFISSVKELGTLFPLKATVLRTDYSFMDWGVSGTREPTIVSLQTDGRTYPENPQEVWEGFRHPLAREFVGDALLATPFSKPKSSGVSLDLVTVAYLRDTGIVDDNSLSVDTPVGKIGFIQEEGYKLRAVANPHRVFQFLLEPLKRNLLTKLKNLESDCTFSQEKGVKWAQACLQDGLSISSVDLSDATNNFPLSMQIEMLKILYPDNPGIIELFSKVSTANWTVNDPEKGTRNMVWSVGQPLGLGPSFPAFAAAHHMVMWGVISAVRDNSSGSGFYKGVSDFLRAFSGTERTLSSSYISEYRIVGDDIVMKTQYEEEYKKTLFLHGLPVSADKTITSCKLAEFASKVITPTGIFVQNKWKTISDRSFLDLAKNLGPTSVGLLRPRQKKVVNLLSSLPEWEGGLGWNPKGIPYEVRVAAYESYISRNRDKDQPYLQEEALAAKKAVRFFGDSFVYKAGIHSIAAMAPDHRKSQVSDRTPWSQKMIDTSFKIYDRSYAEDEVNPLSDKPAGIERPSGDPRQESVLSYFENPKVRDVLSHSVKVLAQYQVAVERNPTVVKEITQRILDRIANDRPLGVDDVKDIISAEAEQGSMVTTPDHSNPSELDIGDLQ